MNPLYYPYASRRNVILGKQGMVATSQPLAAQAGLQILRQGGNAVDAAVATAACLTVVEPTCNGIGGDAFAQVWIQGKLYGLNSSGPAPKLLTREAVLQRGHDTIPHMGVIPITVPGTPAAWASLNERFGKLRLEECLQPAIHYAEQGFALAPNTGDLWSKAYTSYAAHKQKHADTSLDAWFTTFSATSSQSSPPHIGQICALPDHAKTLAAIASSNAKDFYSGHLAEKIDACMRTHGGFLRGEDLQQFAPQWVDPIKVDYGSASVWELPPNGHGIIALMALNILKNFDMSHMDSPKTMHILMEAIKLAFVDGLKHIADPEYMRSDISSFLHADYGCMRAASIGEKAIDPKPIHMPEGGTVYLATADADGNMVSYIQSNFTGFGSGVVVPGTGIALHNRGACFSMEADHVNCVGPQKRPYHTIIPGFITPKVADKTELETLTLPIPTTQNMEGVPFGPFGMMGGYIQPQGHVMLMHHLLDNNLNPQAALDAPRFRWTNGKNIEIEEGFPAHLAAALQGMGHHITYGKVADRDFGRGQIILQKHDVNAASYYMGGTEPRTDGQVAAL